MSFVSQKISSSASQNVGNYSGLEQFSNLAKISCAVCCIKLKDGGTGFLIGKELIKLNHHVLTKKFDPDRVFQVRKDILKNGSNQQHVWCLEKLDRYIRGRGEDLLDLSWIKTALVDDDKNVRKIATIALGRIASHANQESMTEILKCLQIALGDKDHLVRLYVAEAFGKVAHASQESILDFLKWCQTSLRNGTWTVRIFAAKVFRKVATHASQESIHEILKWCLRALEDGGKESCVRQAAMENIEKVAAKAHFKNLEIVKSCQTVLRVTDLVLHESAIKALSGVHVDADIACAEAIGEDEALATQKFCDKVEELQKTLRCDTNKGVNKAAAKALGKVAAYASRESITEILKWLEMVLCYGTWAVRKAAIEALREVVANADQESLLEIWMWCETASRYKENCVCEAAKECKQLLKVRQPNPLLLLLKR